MGGIVGILIGIPIAVFGFLVMRNPLRLSMLAPGEEGYYQRFLLNTTSRNSLRAFGMLICLFGSGIAASGLGAIFETRPLQDVSEGLWALMGITFVTLWCCSVGFAILNAMKGKPLGWSEWFQMRKKGIELGPIDVFPSITPQMRKETLGFTVGLFVLFSLAVGFALFH